MPGCCPQTKGWFERDPSARPITAAQLRRCLEAELSLAHGGVLFLDELAEFPRRILDQLRQPLEEGVLWLSRTRLKCAFPCRITLVAATKSLPLWLARRL